MLLYMLIFVPDIAHALVPIQLVLDVLFPLSFGDRARRRFNFYFILHSVLVEYICILLEVLIVYRHRVHGLDGFFDIELV